MKVAVYVQHLLGSGHLVRAQQLAEALGLEGNDVTLISGGRASEGEGYALVQLPVVKTAPGNFTVLLDQDGHPVDERWKKTRAKKLVAAMAQLAPDVLIVETWPFGRRQMEFEILPMLDQLFQRPDRPMLVCSIRDVLQTRKRSRRLLTLENLERYFSLVLVHGDPRLIELSCSFPEASGIACPVAYTGYIHSECTLDPDNTEGDGEILVSAGGGPAGVKLLQVAAQASKGDDRSWHLLAGAGIDDDQFEDLMNLQC
ncbi:MAG: glycosyltransferase family protein, partial [bacterium]